MTGALYVATVVGALSSFAASQAHLPDRDRMHVSLLLSVDRARHDARAAEEIVDLALAHRQQRYRNDGGDGIDGGPVVGLDLCGNPLRGDVSVFAAAFARAKAEGLGVSLHFAEVPPLATTTTSSTSPSPAQPAAGELETLLSFEPDRLGHVIHVPENLQREIARRRIGLELCLSCNVHARLTSGGFADHHFGYWRDKRCPISLCVSLTRLTPFDK